MARRTKYLKEYDGVVGRACELFGATDVQLAGMLNVSEKTLNNWKTEHDSFLQSIKRGKEIFDSSTVEKSLQNGASGYFYPQQVYDAKAGKVVTLWQFKHGEAVKQIFYLCNRDKERWGHVNQGPGAGSKQIKSNVITPGETEDDLLTPEENKAYSELADSILSVKYKMARGSD